MHVLLSLKHSFKHNICGKHMLRLVDRVFGRPLLGPLLCWQMRE